VSITSIRKVATMETFYRCFNELLNEQSIYDITVQDILDKSNICRSTFYRYFDDKYDLMNGFYTFHVEQFYVNGESLSEIQLETMNFYSQNKKYFKKILTYNGQNSFRQFIYQEGVRLISDFIKRRVPMDILSLDLEFAIRMYNYGAFEITSDWLMEKIEMSPEEINEHRINNMPQIIKDILIKSDAL
jgi:AcrR family transcriptional regulator